MAPWVVPQGVQSLGNGVIIPKAQRSPGSATYHLLSGAAPFLLTGPCGLPKAAPGHTEHSFLNQFWRMLFRSLCYLPKPRGSTSPPLFRGSGGDTRAHPVLLWAQQLLKIMSDWGMLLTTLVVRYCVTQNFVACHTLDHPWAKCNKNWRLSRVVC